MRRQRRPHHAYADDNDQHHFVNGHSDDLMQMERLQSSSQQKFENTIEAKVEEGDTLQALALKFHCTVPEIKRLNKIDKDNEIYARKVIKIPVTVHSILLETLPIVHKSGNNSPKQLPLDEQEPNITRNPLEEAKIMLEEKLLVASVNAAGAATSTAVDSNTMNTTTYYSDDDPQKHKTSTFHHITNDVTSPLLLDDRIPQPRPIRGPSLSALNWSGSDCDMSWVCLLIFILALCFAIPLIYVIYLAEHPHHHNSTTH